MADIARGQQQTHGAGSHLKGEQLKGEQLKGKGLKGEQLKGGVKGITGMQFDWRSMLKSVQGREVFLAPHVLLDRTDFDDVHQGIPTGVWVMGAQTLWEQNITGKDVIIGILDSGIDDSHPDLMDRFAQPRRDFVNDGLKPTRFHYHGTHVAGIIAANGTIKGVAPNAKLIDYRVLNHEGRGTVENIVKAIDQSVKDGCHIINLSLGMKLDDPKLKESIRNAFTNGVLVVVAAGNDGQLMPDEQISFPGNYDEVLCVGAVDFDRIRGGIVRQRFSSRTEQVDVAADGYMVLSTVPMNGYRTVSGTSMASPHVAGFAALLMQKFCLMAKRDPLLRNLKGADRVRQLYSLVKGYTVDIFETGIDTSSGVGLVTALPNLPVRDRTTGKWHIPGFTTGMPIALTKEDTMSSLSTLKLKPDKTVQRFNAEGRKLPMMEQLLDVFGKEFVDMIGTPQLVLTQPMAGTYWISSRNANWDTWQNMLISCFYHPSKEHFASTEGRRGLMKIRAGQGQWAISYQHRSPVNNDVCYGDNTK